MSTRPDFLGRVVAQLVTPPSAPCQVRLLELAQILAVERGSSIVALPVRRIGRLFGRSFQAVCKARRLLVAEGFLVPWGGYKPHVWAMNFQLKGMGQPPSSTPLVQPASGQVADTPSSTPLVGHSAQSLGELELLRQLTALGLEPLTQARVCRQRRWRYDFGLPEYRLLIEADGRGHFSPKKLAEAAERDGWVSANFPEWRILRVPTPELSSGTAIRRIQGAIADYQRRQQTVPLQLPVKITPSHDRQGEAATNVGQLPVLPSGVRLVGWEPKAAPVRLSECSIVTNPELFVQSTLRQLDAHLKGKDRLAGGWGLSGLLARLEACGCVVALDGASGRPMACPQVASNGFPLRRYPQHVLGHCAGARLH